MSLPRRTVEDNTSASKARGPETPTDPMELSTPRLNPPTCSEPAPQYRIRDLLQLIADEAVETLQESLGGEGLSLEPFCEAIYEAISRQNSFTAAESEALRVTIHDFFFAIDVNGGGTVDWNELSHYLIHLSIEQEDGDDYLPFVPAHTVPHKSERIKKRKLQYIPKWDKLVTLDTHHDITDTGTITLSGLVGPPHYMEPICTAQYDFPYDSAEYCPHIDQLLVSTANNLIHFYELQSVDPTQGYRLKGTHDPSNQLILSKRQYTSGRQIVMKWDPDAGRLFTGSDGGVLTGMRVLDTANQLPDITMMHKAHTQAIVDVLCLPTVGAKRVVTAGLDGKAFINEIASECTSKELGHNCGASSLTFCGDHGVIITSGYNDPAPCMWTPVASKNQLVARFTDPSNPHKTRILGVEAFPRTPYVVTADLSGMVKVWDIRRLSPAQTFHFEEMATLSVFDFTVDTSRSQIVSTSKSAIYHKTYFHKQESLNFTLPSNTHDGDVIDVAFHRDTAVFVTCTTHEVSTWDANKGMPHNVFKELTTNHTPMLHKEVAEDIRVNRKLPPEHVITCLCLDTNGRRFFLGFSDGTMTANAIATGAVISNLMPHMLEITAMLYFDGFIVSSSRDGETHFQLAEIPEGVTPVFVRLHVESGIMTITYNEPFAILLVGTHNNAIYAYDMTSSQLGRLIFRVEASLPSMIFVPSVDVSSKTAQLNAATDRAINSYMSPDLFEISSLAVLYPYSVFAAGNVTGRINLWTMKPHNFPLHNFLEWKTFMPRATHNLVATPNALHWVESLCLLLVGDDQGLVTLWSCDEVITKANLLPCRTSGIVQERILPEVMRNVSPKLLRCINASPKYPIRKMVYMEGLNGFYTGAANSVNLWTLEGDLSGSLMQGRSVTQGLDAYLFNTSKPVVVQKVMKHEVEEAAEEGAVEDEDAPSNPKPSKSFIVKKNEGLNGELLARLALLNDEECLEKIKRRLSLFQNSCVSQSKPNETLRVMTSEEILLLYPHDGMAPPGNADVAKSSEELYFSAAARRSPRCPATPCTSPSGSRSTQARVKAPYSNIQEASHALEVSTTRIHDDILPSVTLSGPSAHFSTLRVGRFAIDAVKEGKAPSRYRTLVRPDYSIKVAEVNSRSGPGEQRDSTRYGSGLELTRTQTHFLQDNDGEEINDHHEFLVQVAEKLYKLCAGAVFAAGEVRTAATFSGLRSGALGFVCKRPTLPYVETPTIALLYTQMHSAHLDWAEKVREEPTNNQNLNQMVLNFVCHTVKGQLAQDKSRCEESKNESICFVESNGEVTHPTPLKKKLPLTSDESAGVRNASKSKRNSISLVSPAEQPESTLLEGSFLNSEKTWTWDMATKRTKMGTLPPVPIVLTRPPPQVPSHSFLPTTIEKLREVEATLAEETSRRNQSAPPSPVPSSPELKNVNFRPPSAQIQRIRRDSMYPKSMVNLVRSEMTQRALQKEGFTSDFTLTSNGVARRARTPQIQQPKNVLVPPRTATPTFGFPTRHHCLQYLMHSQNPKKMQMGSRPEEPLNISVSLMPNSEEDGVVRLNEKEGLWNQKLRIPLGKSSLTAVGKSKRDFSKKQEPPRPPGAQGSMGPFNHSLSSVDLYVPMVVPSPMK